MAARDTGFLRLYSEVKAENLITYGKEKVETILKILELLVPVLVGVISTLPGYLLTRSQIRKDKADREKAQQAQHTEEKKIEDDLTLKMSEMSLHWAEEFNKEVARINGELKEANNRLNEANVRANEAEKRNIDLERKLAAVNNIVISLEENKKQLEQKVDILIAENNRLNEIIKMQQEQITKLQNRRGSRL